MPPLLPECIEQVKIPNCTGVTVLTLTSGEMVLLKFGQSLWFGKKKEKSIINLNQFQKFGIRIFDDPTEPHRKLRIEAS